MQAVIDSMNGDYFRCLIENGDLISIHKEYLPQNIQVGDVIKVVFEKDEDASKRQKELMK
ncbi:MAG: hypothetical protein PWR01_3736 [Clostridiales bacterium]|jgi:hypothetical protein|nr:hypothetical protein [Clostridiales bacterium]MDN5282663.1 hypothetical protein [Candidatus Ozemobacter sp.]